MTEPLSDALVLFGATGDLAYQQIFPALHAMSRRGRLDVPVVCTSRQPSTVDQMRQRVRESISAHGGLDREAFEQLASKLRYVSGDYQQPGTFTELRRVLGSARHPLFYLAIPPNLFDDVVAGLAASGCAAGSRVVVEKPFGRDLASANALNRAIHRSFPESAVYRIDHFLGKEPVQNLMYFRFANSFVENVLMAATEHRFHRPPHAPVGRGPQRPGAPPLISTGGLWGPIPLRPTLHPSNPARQHPSAKKIKEKRGSDSASAQRRSTTCMLR